MMWMQQYDLSERAIVTFPTVDVCRARWPGSCQALVMHAKVARWRHCRIHYFHSLKKCLPNYRMQGSILSKISGNPNGLPR